MLTNFFSKSKPITILIVFGLFLGLLSVSFFNGKTAGSFLELLVLFFVTLAFVIFINTKNNLSFDNSYVLLIYVLLLVILPSTLKINTAFYTNLSLLMFFRKLYSLQSSTTTFQKLFDGGLWLGISLLIEPFSLVFILLLYLSVFLHKHLTYQTILIPIIGVLVPILFFFTYCFWTDKTEYFFNLFNWLTTYDINLYSQINYLIPLSFISFIVFLGILVKTPKALAIKNDFRKSWILVLINLICAIALLIITVNKNGSELIYLLFPTAIIVANLIEIYENKWFTDLFIALLISFAIIMSFI